MNAVELGPIVKTLEVRQSPERAFRAFAQEISAWWPMATHSRARDADGERTVRVTVEPRVGGRVFETLQDGRELDWGEVLDWQPGARLELAWRLGMPAQQATRVAVDFESRSEGGCRVILTHSDWERAGVGAAERRGSYDNGWVIVFERAFGGYLESL